MMGTVRPMKRLVGFFLASAVATLVLAAATMSPADAIGGEGEAWPAFTESSSCGAQRVSTPHAGESGWLARSAYLRGDFAAMFGRTVGDVHKELVLWTIPGSFERLAIHPWIVPALDMAGDAIVDAQADDLEYRIDGPTTYSTASRTIAGSIRISRHTYGTAFDVNASKNPYRGDNRLITDIPEWWLESFLDAGFCWGGLWIGSKDSMHFAWQGPAFSGYESLPLPYEPVTEPADFSDPDARLHVLVPQPNDTIETVLADLTGNGAPDIVRIVPSGTDLLLHTSVASRNHNACSARTSVVAGLGERPARSVAIGFGDWDGRGGQDLWILSDEDGHLGLTVRWAYGGYSAETTALLDVPAPSAGAWISTADADGNGTLDLFVVNDGNATIWDIDPDSGASSVQKTVPIPFSGSGDFTLGDYDLDNLPDLWRIGSGKVEIALASDDYASIAETQIVNDLPSSIVDVIATDYDGDGRRDIVTFDGVSKTAWLGNTAIPDGLPLEVWFLDEKPECDDEEQAERLGELRFATSGWVAEGSYKWRSANGFTVTCNPEDDGCRTPVSTHAMVAEFFAWIDGLDPAAGNPTLAAARALDRAGYELSCPLADLSCWSEPMPTPELSARFGIFLSERRGIDVAPHRWILPEAVRSHPGSAPQ